MEEREASPGLSPILLAGSRKALPVFLTSSSLSTSFTSSSASSAALPPPGRRRRVLESEHVYENPAELVAAVHKSRMSSTLSSLEGKAAEAGSQTLSSEDGRACLSPATRIRLAADLHRHSTSDDDSGCALEEYAWVPSGLRPDLVHQYFSLIPEDKVPYVGSVGEKWRVRQLLLQLPPQDSEARYCRNLSATEGRELRQFSSQRKKEALGRGTPRIVPFALAGTPCHQCGEAVSSGELGLFCARLKGAVWHPGCFQCRKCEELLVDLIYFAADGHAFCGRHHAETHKPRCEGCDEIIFSEECTEAEGGSWHLHHFACLECEAELGGQRYVIREERPYCLPCFQAVFPDLCAACRRPIAAQEPRVALDAAQWHASDSCYACAACRRSLLGKPALPRRGTLFCSLDCFADLHPSSSTQPSAPSSSAPSPAHRKPRRSPPTLPPPDSTRRPPPRLALPQASSDEENDYETVPSFRASPPTSPKDMLILRHQLDRMTMSVHQEQEESCAESRRYRQAASRRQRRHRSLSDLRGSEQEEAHSSSSRRHHWEKSSESSKASSRSRGRPSVTFCSSARDPRPSKKPKRRCKRGSSETRSSERSYARAVGKPIAYHGGRLAATFKEDLEEPVYADVVRDSNCTTCSSSSSEDEADYLTADFLLAQLRSHSAHNSLRRPPPSPARRKKGIRGSKLAHAAHAGQNCIVS